MKYLSLLILLLPGIASGQQRVVIAAPDGVQLQAKLFLPAGAVTGAGVVALHGCAGPWPKRDDAWARLLAAQGHAVLLPDSFGSRGLRGECKQAAHTASAYTARRGDALAAAAWLQGQKFAPAGGVLLIGWSDGGTTVLAALGPGLPAGLVRGAVAFYPACSRTARDAAWRNGAPLLILIGAADDWTPAEPCQALAAKNPGVRVMQLVGAYHDFDVPDDPVHEIFGLPYTKSGSGTAHAGGNPAARRAALRLVPAFFNGLPPA
jgi:dienelactone hydrolase